MLNTSQFFVENVQKGSVDKYRQLACDEVMLRVLQDAKNSSQETYEQLRDAFEKRYGKEIIDPIIARIDSECAALSSLTR